MQKIYLLLRNNEQSGPHTLEDLINLELQPKDLIWVEGRSAGWAYPAEIPSLIPFLPKQLKQTSLPEPLQSKTAEVRQHVFVSCPKNDGTQAAATTNLEDKAAAIRTRALQSQASGTKAVEIKYSKTLEEVETNYTKWAFQNRKKKKILKAKHLMIASILIIGSVSGWMLAKQIFNESKPVYAVRQITQSAELDIQPEFKVEEPEESFIAGKTLPQNISSSPTKTSLEFSKVSENRIRPEPETLIPAPAPENENVSPENNAAAHAEINTTEKKKNNLFKKIGDWLKEEPGGNKDVAQKEKKESYFVDISDQVNVRLIIDQDEWMMGIRGQKINLANRSDANLHSALVELFYYSEQKALIEKRKIEVSDLASGKTKTISIPDHKLADHVDVKLVAATGVGQ
ncbi:MAG: DUF4339 domain-containing protein [Flavisolibacter sp.]|jgi:hypothetical protein|nr:DUF4339 domain-containing protein [Flavisolibacter sp.]